MSDNTAFSFTAPLDRSSTPCQLPGTPARNEMSFSFVAPSPMVHISSGFRNGSYNSTQTPPVSSGSPATGTLSPSLPDHHSRLALFSDERYERATTSHRDPMALRPQSTIPHWSRAETGQEGYSTPALGTTSMDNREPIIFSPPHEEFSALGGDSSTRVQDGLSSAESSPRAVIPDDILSDIRLVGMARDLKLNEGALAAMRAITGIARSGPEHLPDNLTMILLLLMTSISQLRQALEDGNSSTSKMLLQDIKTVLEKSFQLAPEQKTNVQLMVKNMIIEPNRREFKVNFDVEALKCIQAEKTTLGFVNVFGNDARQEVLRSYIRTYMSSAKNSIRHEIIISVYGPHANDKKQTKAGEATGITGKLGLLATVQVLVSKFRRISFKQHNESAWIVQIAILRKVARDNPEIWGRADDDDKTETVTENTQTMAGTVPQKRNGDGVPVSKRGGSKPGKIGYWTLVERYLAAESVNKSGSVTSKSWVSFTNDLIRQDNYIYDRLVYDRAMAELNPPPVGTGDGLLSSSGLNHILPPQGDSESARIHNVFSAWTGQR